MTGEQPISRIDSVDLTKEEVCGLSAARDLARAGMPIFIAKTALDSTGVWDATGGTGKTGYVLPPSWQRTVADPSVVDSWRPGDALCAVTGHGFDALDVDTRHGGDESAEDLREEGLWPHTYARAATPSGGTHDFVASLGVRSRDGFRPGLDVKAGTPDGYGCGFVFIAPTIKMSKTTDELGRYRWLSPPDLDGLRDGDASGEKLAELIRGLRTEPTGHRSVAQIRDIPAYVAEVCRRVARARPGTRNRILKE